VHAAGLLHRDIKPDNIFLCDSEEEIFVKLLDFGIAKKEVSIAGDDASLDGSTNTGQVVGTPFYMSPEQVTAQKGIDARSDLWALGVVAFQALTGTRPFDGPSFGALAVRIATGAPPRITEVDPRLPKELDAWFARACAREPADRFATARELADGLRAALGGLVPPMSDSGQRPLSASSPSGRERAASGSARAEDEPGTPSFVNASTMKSDAPPPAAGSAQLGATGSAVALARAPWTEEPGARRRKHVALGSIFALGSAAVVVLLSRPGAPPRSPGTEPVPGAIASAVATEVRAVPSASPPPSAIAAEPVGSAPAIPVAFALAAGPDGGRATSPTAPPGVTRPRADAGAASAVASGAAPSAASSSGARPGLRPPGSHDDPLF
jgi:serine/threonine-protein kinase